MQLRQLGKTKDGFIALVTVVVLAAIMSIVTVFLLIISTDSVNSVGVSENSLKANQLAHSCAEIALGKLKINIFYTGNETISYGTNMSCFINTITGSGNLNRTIITTGTVKNAVRKSQVVVSVLNPSTVITSWQETS
jgi:hypothetical protein